MAQPSAVLAKQPDKGEGYETASRNVLSHVVPEIEQYDISYEQVVFFAGEKDAFEGVVVVFIEQREFVAAEILLLEFSWGVVEESLEKEFGFYAPGCAFPYLSEDILEIEGKLHFSKFHLLEV